MADKKAIFTDDDCECDNDTPETDLLDSHPGCLECGRTQRAMKCCTKCHSAFYCSRECFVKHWPVHKKSCQVPSTQALLGANQQLGKQCGDDGGGRFKYRVIHLHKPADDFPESAHCQSIKTSADNHLSGKPFCQSGKPSSKPPSANLQSPTQSVNSLSSRLSSVSVSCQSSSRASDTGHQSRTWVPEEGSSVDPVESSVDMVTVPVTLRYNKDKRSFKVGETWDGATILSRVSSTLHCMPDTMRLIHKGRQLRADTVRDAVRAGAVFQVIGEPMEDESGLTTRDIEVLMEQLGVERNAAVRALRQCQGDLIDAMMAVGNR